jgi:AcrR family transcriptional regulator
LVSADSEPHQTQSSSLSRSIQPTSSVQRSLRERKKVKTRAAIQRSALRLFLEQGYEATTIEQIAEAAEVSPSTFFRYFPSKEDVALYDDLDPILIAAYAAQPTDLSPLAAMRGALHVVFHELSEGDMERQWERSQLILSIPDLRMRLLDQFSDIVALMARMLATRTGRRQDDPTVRLYAGAVIGALFAALFDGIGESVEEFIQRMDTALEYLESGLRL